MGRMVIAEGKHGHGAAGSGNSNGVATNHSRLQFLNARVSPKTQGPLKPLEPEEVPVRYNTPTRWQANTSKAPHKAGIKSPSNTNSSLCLAPFSKALQGHINPAGSMRALDQDFGVLTEGRSSGPGKGKRSPQPCN